MKTITLDVHTEACQMAVVTEDGEVVYEAKVETTPEELRRAVGGVPGCKRVIFEEGPLSGWIHDALQEVVDEVISCDPRHNALIASAEDSNDERDARRLAMLVQANAIHGVYIPPEPYRTLRSLVHYAYTITQAMTQVKNQMKGLCRRYGIRCKGTGLYRSAARPAILKVVPSAMVHWQLTSLCRRLDGLRRERVGVHRMIVKQSATIDAVTRLQTIPGVGPSVGPAIVAWIADPDRFKNRNARSSYGGLGLKHDISNWKTTMRARASKRGQRELKRVLFLAARAAVRSKSALAKRYEARRAAGWEDKKAIRDLARTILFTACAIWKNGREYNDAKVSVPNIKHVAR